MYWKKGTSRVTTPTIGAHTVGTNLDLHLTLVTESGETLKNAYLFTAMPEFAGLMQAKLSTESTYKTIKGSFDANCFLGSIGASTETTIDFRIAFPSGTADGYRIIPVMVGHDDGADNHRMLYRPGVCLWRRCHGAHGQ